jgi:hypothetical protein
MTERDLGTDAGLLATVEQDSPAQTTIHSPGIQPFTRRAVAERLASAPASANDPAWNSAPDVGGFFRESTAYIFSRDTQAAITYDDEALYVRMLNAGAPARKSSKDAFYHGDTAELFIDATHDHHHYLQFAITPAGGCFSAAAWKSLGTQRWEMCGKSDPLPAEKWTGKAALTDSSWSAFFRIPFETLGCKPQRGRPLGLNLMRQRCDGAWSWYLWNETHRGPICPWGYGDLYFDEAPQLYVERADLGELRLWENRGALLLQNLQGRPVEVLLRIEVRTGAADDKTFYTGSVRQTVPAKTNEPMRLAFSFPFDPADYKYTSLHLLLTDAAETRLWSGAYRLGYEQGRNLHLDDRREGPPSASPSPADPDFHDKKRAYIMRRLPRFLRKTTAQGAPSDFTLEAEDGSVVFDLMCAGVLQRMADYIYSRFDNDVDRLLGAMFFMHQGAVMSYAHVPTSLADKLGPLSIIRLGSAQCCCFASALLGLLEKLKCEATGKSYRGLRVNVPGHVTTVVEFGGKMVHLDGSLGRFYFLPDNRTLASIDELLADPALARQESPYLEEFFRKGAASSDVPTYSGIERGVWPPGAPAQ